MMGSCSVIESAYDESCLAAITIDTKYPGKYVRRWIEMPHLMHQLEFQTPTEKEEFQSGKAQYLNPP